MSWDEKSFEFETTFQDLLRTGKFHQTAISQTLNLSDDDAIFIVDSFKNHKDEEKRGKFIASRTRLLKPRALAVESIKLWYFSASWRRTHVHSFSLHTVIREFFAIQMIHLREKD